MAKSADLEVMRTEILIVRARCAALAAAMCEMHRWYRSAAVPTPAVSDTADQPRTSGERASLLADYRAAVSARAAEWSEKN